MDKSRCPFCGGEIHPHKCYTAINGHYFKCKQHLVNNYVTRPIEEELKEKLLLKDNNKAIEKCVKIPISELISTNGKDVVQIYKNYYWVVTPNDEVLFFKGRTPQCNADKKCAESFLEKLYPNCTVEQIPIAFVPWKD